MFIDSPILALFFLLGVIALTGMTTSLQRVGQLQAKEAFQKSFSLSSLQRLLVWIFTERKWEGLFLTLNFTKYFLLLCYSIAAFVFLTMQESLSAHSPDLWLMVTSGIAIIGVGILAHVLMTLLSLAYPNALLRITGPLAYFFILICTPLSLVFLRIFKSFLRPIPREKGFALSDRLRERILEILQESELTPYLEPNDQKLILSVISFKERIAREVMVPRINVFSLPAETTIQEAAQSFLHEGYSRIPVYRDSIDHVIGVLLYKDILKVYAHPHKDLNASIEHLVKPILYTPETKKISQLLQEFRSKQIHLAIVVDEYGGTEGVVTIEDILEELVGEIADEYDIEEELLYSSLPSGGWVVDARMSIIDIEDELRIKIPTGPEYDTIGGYIFHRAGSIPSKGWRIHHDDFDLEIISSNDRSIDKIRIIPTAENKSPK